MIDEPSKELAPRTAKNAEPSLVVKRKPNNQIANTEESKRHFALWLLDQSKKHRDTRESQETYGDRYGISHETLAKWRNQDRQFNQILREELPDTLLYHAPEVYADIADRAKRGDSQMKALYLKQAKLLEAEKHETRSLNVNVDVSSVPRRGADGP